MQPAYVRKMQPAYCICWYAGYVLLIQLHGGVQAAYSHMQGVKTLLPVVIHEYL